MEGKPLEIERIAELAVPERDLETISESLENTIVDDVLELTVGYGDVSETIDVPVFEIHDSAEEISNPGWEREILCRKPKPPQPGVKWDTVDHIFVIGVPPSPLAPWMVYSFQFDTEHGDVIPFEPAHEEQEPVDNLVHGWVEDVTVYRVEGVGPENADFENLVVEPV